MAQVCQIRYHTRDPKPVGFLVLPNLVQSGSWAKIVNPELNTGSGPAIWLNLGLNMPEHIWEVQFMFK